MTRSEFLSSFENVCELFENIGSISSRIAKEAMLKDYPDKEFLKDILLYTYNPYYVYGIDKAKIRLGDGVHAGGYTDIFGLLDYLRENNTGRENDRFFVLAFISDLKNDFMCSWAEKIILKDLKIGINISTINKVFPKLIPEFKVGLCKTYEDSSSLRYDSYIVQPKLDGVRIIAVCTGGSAELYTRNGMKVEGYDEIIKDLSQDCWKDYVLDGEIMTDNFDGTMEGLFALKTGKKATYNVFDIMTIQEFNEQRCATPYIDRYAKYMALFCMGETKNVVRLQGTCIEKYDIVKDISVLDEKARQLGYEGLVLKGLNSPYEFCTPSKRSWAWVKYKSWHSEDFEVVGMEEGTGKYEGMLGALVVDVNGVKVKVGSGFSDDQRENLWDSGYAIEQIAEIKYQDKTKDGSLRFPSFIKFRNDI